MLEKFVMGRDVQIDSKNIDFPNICFKCTTKTTEKVFIQMRKPYLLWQEEKILDLLIPICNNCSKRLKMKRFFWKYTNLFIALILMIIMVGLAVLFGEGTWQCLVFLILSCFPMIYLRTSEDHVFNWFVLGVWGYNLKKDFSSFILKFKNDEIGRQIELQFLDV